MKEINYLEEGQSCYLHHAGEESIVFEFGSVRYNEAIAIGWTHARQDVPKPEKPEDVIQTGFETVDLANPETIEAQLKALDLFSLRTLCVELQIEGMEKANGVTCIKKIKEYVAK